MWASLCPPVCPPHFTRRRANREFASRCSTQLLRVLKRVTVWQGHQTMISPMEGRYDMLQLQPVGPSLHSTHGNVHPRDRRTTAHNQGTKNTRQQYAYLFSSYISTSSANIRELRLWNDSILFMIFFLMFSGIEYICTNISFIIINDKMKMINHTCIKEMLKKTVEMTSCKAISWH